MLIVSGSADNSVKYWSMYLDEASLLLPKENSAASPKLAGSFNGSFTQGTQHIIEGMGHGGGSGLLIKTEPNLNWPVQISIQPYDSCQEHSSERYLLIVVLANGFIFLNMIDKVDDFVMAEAVSSLDTDSPPMFQGSSGSIDGSPISVNNPNRFNFKYKLRISDTFRSLLSILNAEFGPGSQDGADSFFDDENAENLLVSNKSRTWFDRDTKLLTVYVVTENNSNQSNKFFMKKWLVRTSESYGLFDWKSVEDEANEIEKFTFLNKRSLKFMNISQFEIISFGSK
jgi:hypothetical protein